MFLVVRNRVNSSFISGLIRKQFRENVDVHNTFKVRHVLRLLSIDN